jgi:hypothetical protein
MLELGMLEKVFDLMAVCFLEDMANPFVKIRKGDGIMKDQFE